MDEFSFIARYLTPLTRQHPAALGLQDDAAVWNTTPGCQTVFTKDAMVAGIHFFPEDAPDLIARKLLRTNLSDLAAMGATPKAYLLALMLPDTITEAWLAAFCQGLATDNEQFQLPLIGGDTVTHPGPLTLSLTAIGEVSAGKALTRSGAQVGDTVYLSGTLGDSALGLAVLKGELALPEAEHREYLIDRYHLPQPRIALGQGLNAHAAMDVSDGLLQDAGHLARASNIAITLHQAALPLAAAAQAALQQSSQWWDIILTGGDDYELLFTSSAPPPPGVTTIGMVTAADPAGSVTLLGADGQPVTLTRQPGFRHSFHPPLLA